MDELITKDALGEVKDFDVNIKEEKVRYISRQKSRGFFDKNDLIISLYSY